MVSIIYCIFSFFFRFYVEPSQKTFKSEPSSKFSHFVLALGSYRNSPFVTGHDSATNGLKTEILNYGSGGWEQASDYPFSSDRYVSNDFMKSYQNLHEKKMMKNQYH